MKVNPEPATVEPSESDSWHQVALVEVDRFCKGCGYNLRTQPVRREPRTRVLLCRCPECGCFQATSDAITASMPWLHRLATLVLLIWVFLIGSGIVGIGLMEGAASAITLDELTTYNRVGQVWQARVRPTMDHYTEFMCVVTIISFAIGFVSAMLSTVVFCHWSRWGYYMLVLSIPALTALIVWLVWRTDVPHLASWGAGYIRNHMFVQMGGGVLGVFVGRPLARLVVQIALPPRPRAALAFLWLADGLTPPAVSRPARPSA